MGQLQPFPQMNDLGNLPGFPAQQNFQQVGNSFPPGIDGGMPIPGPVSSEQLQGGGQMGYAPQQQGFQAPGNGVDNLGYQPMQQNFQQPAPQQQNFPQQLPPPPGYPQQQIQMPQQQQFAPQIPGPVGMGQAPPAMPGEKVATVKEVEKLVKACATVDQLGQYASDARAGVQKAVQKKYAELTGQAPAPSTSSGDDTTFLMSVEVTLEQAGNILDFLKG